MRSIWLSPILFLITLFPHCSDRCDTLHVDRIPPEIYIEWPIPDYSFCEAFTVRGLVSDHYSGLNQLRLYIEGEVVGSLNLDGESDYYFEFDVDQSDFPEWCDEAELSVVAWDNEDNEAIAKLDVILCNDSTEPIVTALADEDVLTSEFHCTAVSVQIIEENFAWSSIPGFGSWEEPEYEFLVCGSDLEMGENVITVTAWDFCENEGSTAITITYSPNSP